jgi:hypothetical protein
MSSSFTLKPGVWSWKYEHGEFEVSFVEGGEFICVQYSAPASWKGCCGSCSEKITIEWGQYGNYTMQLADDGASMQGFYTGYPDDWRKASFLRAHTSEELASIKTAAAANHGHQHTAACNH